MHYSGRKHLKICYNKEANIEEYDSPYVNRIRQLKAYGVGVTLKVTFTSAYYTKQVTLTYVIVMNHCFAHLFSLPEEVIRRT